MQSVLRYGRVVSLCLGVLLAWNGALATPTPKDMPGRVVPGGKPAAGAPAAPADDSQAADVTASWIFDDAVRLKALLDEIKSAQDKIDAKQDAKGVAAATATTDRSTIAALLKAYGIDVNNISTTPFLNHVKGLTNKDVATATPAPVSNQGAPNGATPTGLFSASSVADALGTLIATRFKQEAEMEGLRRLAKLALTTDARSGHPLSAGLPKTMAYIKTLQVPNVTPIYIRVITVNDWAVLQASFKTDMAAMPSDLRPFVDALFGDPSKITADRYLSWIAATLGEEFLQKGRSPYQLIDASLTGSAAFNKKYGLPKNSGAVAPYDFDAGLNGLAILSHLLTKDGASQWHSMDEVTKLLDVQHCSPDQCDGLYLLLGLSYARDTTLYKTVDAWMNNNGLGHILPDDITQPIPRFANLSSAMSKLTDLASAFDSLRQHVADLPSPVINDISEVGPVIDDLGTVATTTIDIAQLFAQKPAAPPTPSAGPSVTCDGFCQAHTLVTTTTQELGALVDIIGDIHSKQYTAAMGEVIAYVGQHLQSADPDVKTFLTNNGPFIAAAAAAKSSDDLKAALDDYSLPAGSYSQQQQTAFSLTLNSFFGVAAGAETLSGNLSGTNIARTRARLGFAAPVGLDFNFGRAVPGSAPSGGFFDTGAWSVFVPILDLGAVASWRLGSGGGTVPALTWQNIVAPGLYVVWSKRDSPFSILVGAQYGPELRKISAAGGDTIEKAAIQFPSIEFTFNIPIFSLYQTGSLEAKPLQTKSSQ